MLGMSIPTKRTRARKARNKPFQERLTPEMSKAVAEIVASKPNEVEASMPIASEPSIPCDSSLDDDSARYDGAIKEIDGLKAQQIDLLKTIDAQDKEIQLWKGKFTRCTMAPVEAHIAFWRARALKAEKTLSEQFSQ